jgi:hypothetical protein
MECTAEAIIKSDGMKEGDIIAVPQYFLLGHGKSRAYLLLPDNDMYMIIWNFSVIHQS